VSKITKQSYKNVSDEELVRLYVSTQKNIYFERLYDRYADKVYRKCLSFVKDQAKAEDFTHDIFLKLIVKIGTYSENAKFSTWLYSITYNFCMDQMRLGKRMSEDSLDENFDIEEDDDDTELVEIQSVELKKALEKISPEEKAILLMKYQDDFSIKDIADHFNLTESAVKMRLKRTKEKVKKFYVENIFFWLIAAIKLITFWNN
jgi:RNA polymerase sigma-70 factor (ECF subfamily)